MATSFTPRSTSAFYTSPFSDAALLVIDGRGGPVPAGPNNHFETISIGHADGLALNIDTFQSGLQSTSSSSWRYITANSLGWFYKTVTEVIGFGSAGEGKTMGLASYGRPTFLEEFSEFCRIDVEGRFIFDPYAGLWDFLTQALQDCENSFQVRADLAATAQYWLEEGVLNAARAARLRSSADRLCYAGGVALNGVANHRLRTESDFEEIFLWPPCGDNGLAIGAAFYGYHALLSYPRKPPSRVEAELSPFYGRIYTSSEIERALRRVALHIKQCENIAERAAELIVSGEPFAFFQHGSEIGPRALGHRSIFLDPSLAIYRGQGPPHSQRLP